MIALPNPHTLLGPVKCPNSMSTTTETMNYYKITEIEFDFDYEDLTEYEKEEIINDAKNCLWDSPNGEESLADVITNNTGWCIKSLRYDVVN